MKAPLPPNFTPPFWATRNFRLLLGAGRDGAGGDGRDGVPDRPRAQPAAVRQKQADPNAFVPKPAVAGEAREVKYEGVLDRVKDGSSIDDQEQPYQYLVRSLSRMDAALLAKDAKTVDYVLLEDARRDAGRDGEDLALFLSPTRSGSTALRAA
jgi:hypothetical protein